jgi:hypothetical protein
MAKNKRKTSKADEDNPDQEAGPSGGAQKKDHKTPENKRRRKGASKQQPHNSADDERASDESCSSDDESEDNIVKMFEEIRKSQNFLSSRFESFENRLEELVADNKVMKKEITTLTAKVDCQQEQIDGLNREVNTIKQRSLAKDVVISGLPDLNNISSESIVKTINNAYGFGMEKISNMYVTKGFSKVGKTTYNNIVISFCDTNTKNKILQQQKEIGPILWSQLMNGVPENLCSRQIFIAERLTPFNLSLLNACRDLRAKKKITFAWSKYGSVFVKIKSDSNRMKIVTQKDLLNLPTALAT